MAEGAVKKPAFAKTQSVCPVCLKVIEAEKVVGEDGFIHMQKICPVHGGFDVLLWEGDLVSYLLWDTAGEGDNRPEVTVPAQEGCPHDCGLCEHHESAGCCVLLELTARCNLRCPVCFASAGEGESEDPALEEIGRQYDMLMARGGPFNIQLSGGEPTVRDDLPEIVALGKEKGFAYFQLNTNGLRLAEEPDYAAKLRRAGVSCAFLQFDGLTDDVYVTLRGKPLLEKKLRAIENCKQGGLPVVLVPTVAPGVNDQQQGDILRFAAKQMPAVRGVHLQPISYFGRCALKAPALRLTIPRLLSEIERQTGGVIRQEDFGGGGAESAYCSFHASYRKNEEGVLAALPRRRSSCCCQKSSEARDFVADRWGMPEEEVQDAFDEFLLAARENTFTVSGMLFQDAMNLDLARLRRCYICEVDAARGMVPFCAYNLTDTQGNALYRKGAKE